VVVGTNLVRGGLLDEIVTAVSAGRLIGDAGVVAGVTWQAETRPFRNPTTRLLERRDSRIPRLLLALDFRF
jgi:hypothetical protein